MADTKKAFINRDFNDAGTGASFIASIEGKPETLVDIEGGAFANYFHAGLVSEPVAAAKAGAAAPAG